MSGCDSPQPASGYQLRQYEIDGLRQRGILPIPFDAPAVSRDASVSGVGGGVGAAAHTSDCAPVDGLGISRTVGAPEVGAGYGAVQTEAQP